MFRKLLFVSFCLLLLVACVPTSEEEAPVAGDQVDIERTSDSTEVNHDATTKLALRLLAPQYPGAPSPNEVQLLVGELPADLALPLPANTEVVGSIVRGSESTEVVLDSDQSAEAILSYFAGELTNAGWETFEEPAYGGGGFMPSEMAENRTFCRDEDDLVMWMMATELKDAPTDIRLNINSAHGYSPCDQSGYYGPPQGDPYLMMPSLIAPADAEQISGGGGGGSPFNASSNATLKTELSVTELSAHYASQLEEQGWTRNDVSDSDPVSWSTWTFSDEEGNAWRGLFFTTKLDEAHRTVYVEVMRLDS